MTISDYITERYGNQFVNNDELITAVLAQKPQLKKRSVISAIDKMVNDGLAFRVGRGVYGIGKKRRFNPLKTDYVKNLLGSIEEEFPYLKFTVSEISSLDEFIEMQTFVTPIVVEVEQSAIRPLVSRLRSEKLDAFPASDGDSYERYRATANPIIVKRLPASSPLVKIDDQANATTLEKLLVDICCDTEIYAAYDDYIFEIYQNATEVYAVNYSKLLRYATRRTRYDTVLEALLTTDEYPKVKGLLA